MNKNVVYCICSYLPEQENIKKSLLPIIDDIKKWANYQKADFKLITKIPDVIEDMFNSIKKEKIKINPYRIHALKAWNTKYELLQQFYKSNYSKMLYIDCDILPHNRDFFNFDNYNKSWYIIRRNVKPNKPTIPIKIAQQYLNKEMPYRFQAGIIYITRDHECNLSEIFNYNKIYKLWQLNSKFLREETAINYIIYNEDLIDKILPSFVNGKKHFRFLHIGNDESKINFKYNQQWKQLIK